MAEVKVECVHCHVCPLKYLCKFSAAGESWRFQNGRYPDTVKSRRLMLADLQKIQWATNNCPLKKTVLGSG